MFNSRVEQKLEINSTKSMACWVYFTLSSRHWALAAREVLIRITGLTIDGKSNQSIDLPIKFKDYVDPAAQGVFFGDRPLANPGYTKFDLAGVVSTTSLATRTDKASAALDVWRIEQRLKYLGFPAMGSEPRNGGSATLPYNTIEGNKIKDFSVRGTWAEDRVGYAVQLFYKVINYGSAQTGRYLSNATRTAATHYKVVPANGPAYFSSIQAGAQAISISNGSNVLQWLNAYNAPHWTTLSGIAGWANNQTNLPPLTSIENYGSSWMRDLMTAKGVVTVAGLTQGNSSFLGATDANHGYTPFGHASHDLGMSMDLGISTHMTAVGAMSYHGNTPSTAIQQVVSGATPGTWSNNLAAEYVRRMVNDPGRRQDLAFSDFALLYAATISGSNGARDSLASRIKGSTDTTAVLNALFGDGTQTGSIVNGVIIGGSVGVNDTYPDIRYALNHLGFRMVSQPTLNTLPSVSNNGPHYHHFHIYFQAPTRRDLSNLLVAENTGDFVSPPVVQKLAQASEKKITPAIVRNIEKKLTKLCGEVENQSSSKKLGLGGAEADASVGAALLGYLKYPYGIEATGKISTIVIKQPSHGRITAGEWSTWRDFPSATFQNFKYTPNSGFIGTDTIGFEITVNGKAFRASLRINVVETWNNADSCNPPGEDRGELSDSGSYAWELDSLDEILPLQTVTPEQWLQNAALSAILASASRSLTNFADVPGVAVGETTGKGLNAQIILDTNAAGHNWYIDPTPLDNRDDYLPLSVLLHEYGHALGLEHSANSRNFMAASLLPGVRKLPSNDELDLMARLVAELKVDDENGDALQCRELKVKYSQQVIDFVEFISSFCSTLELNMSTKYRVNP